MQSRKVAAEPLPALPKSRLARAMGIGSIAFAWAMGLAGFHRSRSLRVCLLAGLPVRRFVEFARLVEYSGLPRSRIEQSTIRFLSKCHAKWRRTVVLRKTRRPTNLLLAEVSGKPQVTFSKLSDVGVEDGFEFRKTTVRRH